MQGSASGGQQPINMIELLAAVGSLASIIGLGIVILQEATKDQPIEHSVLAWRIALFAIALIAVSGSLIFTLVWASDAYYDRGRSVKGRVFAVTIRAVLGMVIFGVSLDALFAVIYWTYWLVGPSDFINHDVIGWIHRISS